MYIHMYISIILLCIIYMYLCIRLCVCVYYSVGLRAEEIDSWILIGEPSRKQPGIHCKKYMYTHTHTHTHTQFTYTQCTCILVCVLYDDGSCYAGGNVIHCLLLDGRI